MAVPTIDPHLRDPAQVAPADSYQPADSVWVYRHGLWRAGVIETASARAVTVTYQPTAARGTGVDTVTALYVLARTDIVPALDSRDNAEVLSGQRGVARR